MGLKKVEYFWGIQIVYFALFLNNLKITFQPISGIMGRVSYPRFLQEVQKKWYQAFQAFYSLWYLFQLFRPF